VIWEVAVTDGEGVEVVREVTAQSEGMAALVALGALVLGDRARNSARGVLSVRTARKQDV
jgi:hypothetical protein